MPPTRPCYFRTTVGILLQRDVPLHALNDSSSIFSLIIRSTTSRERRLLIDLQAAREAFDNKKRAEIGWSEQRQNFADALTKSKPCEAMMDLLSQRKLGGEALQWVLRDFTALS